MACMDVCPLASELSVINSNISCPEEGCGKVFKASSALNMHLTKHHRNSCLTKRDSSVTVRYFCPEEKCVYHVSASRHFTQMKYLKQHYLKVHSEKRFSCQSCDKAFATQELLKYHLQVCGIKFTCSCGNSYSSYEALLTHSKRKQHTFDDKFKLGNKRTKPESSADMPLRKDNHCFSIDMMQPIYILPKPLTDDVNVTVLSSDFCNNEVLSTVVHDKSMQTDPVEPRRKKTCSPSKSTDKSTKRRASAQTQTGGIMKSYFPKKTAETQTIGDDILRKAMADANIPTHDGTSTSRPSHSTRKRKYNSGTQTAGRRNLRVSPNACTSNNKPVLEQEPDAISLSPKALFCMKKDVGLPDLWVSEKSTSSTQTVLVTDEVILQTASFQTRNRLHNDLNLDLFGQDGGLCTSSNLESIFEDNSDSFDNVVNSTSNFESVSETQTVSSLGELSGTNFTSCNVTQTDQNLNHLFPRNICDDENHSSFTLRTTTETQTTDDLVDLDCLITTNMWTQTSGDSLFLDLDFADTQTQTAWPLYGDDVDTESILVSAETQTSISDSTFDLCPSPIDVNRWSNELSHIETQTSEKDLKESEEDLKHFMAELDS